MSLELDQLDIKILSRLQTDASEPTAELAEHVGLSQSPCWRRIQRLREAGYIERQVVLLNRARFGESFYIFARLKMRRLSSDERAEFVRTVELTPEITECYAVFGRMDIMMKILAPDMKWYEDFTFKTILRLPGVDDVRSIVTFSEIKMTSRIPLPRL